ncbi:unnamed protein product [Nippostrongylus brasiliensis]|uniref:CPSF_A domain-containing protein n=1 Tax=Nippostrongylus brasiliensis TaxID=27835 RepID=A0A0N4XRY6_NIPBR|nr:unnamed protein product [Nippostrongylus brasiliensis]
MEELFLDSPSCFTCGDDNIAVGFVDGIVQLAAYDLQKKAFKVTFYLSLE